VSFVAKRRFFEFGRFRLDADGCVLFRGQHAIPLSPKAAGTLLLLVENAGQVVGKEEILKRVWPGTFVGDGSLTRTVSDLRKALTGGGEEHQYIATISKRGYRFVALVRESPESPASPSTGKVMLVVLPFENLSGKKSHEYLSDGLTEEMITQLGRLNPARLGVIARTSAVHYKGCDKTVRQIGSQLNVAYVLEGSVRRSGVRVRVTAQLIQVADQTHLWCESYDRDLGDILNLQRDVARAIANQINIKLVHQEGEPRAVSSIVSAEAHESYLRGRYLWNKRTQEALRSSIRCFERSILIDPGYATAYAGLADSYLTLQDQGYLLTLQATAEAKRAASQALRIDETLAEPHISLAHAHFHEFDWRAAEKEFQRGIELNPNYAIAHFYYANYLLVMEHFAEAIAEARHAEALDPVSLAAGTNTATALYFAGRYDESIQHSLQILETDPKFVGAYEDLGRAYLEKGIIDDSIAAFEKAVEGSGRSPHYVASLAHAFAVARNEKKARTPPQGAAPTGRSGRARHFDSRPHAITPG
jgi:TolB-like protein/DNA-binding SARP family transcriptional activator